MLSYQKPACILNEVIILLMFIQKIQPFNVTFYIKHKIREVCVFIKHKMLF